MNNKSIGTILLLILTLFCLNGCDRGNPGGAAALQPEREAAAAATVEPLRLAYAHKVCYEPFIIAGAINLFAEEGLKVECKLVGGGIQAAESLVTGAADIAAMGDAPFLIAASRNSAIRLLTRYGGGEKMHRVIARTGIVDIRALQQARIGIQLGSSTHGAFIAWAETVGLDPGGMRFISLRPLDMPQAMQTGQIDVMAGSEPWPSNVEALCGGKVHELADFSSLGNTFPLVIAGKNAVTEKRPQDIAKLLRALRKAVAFMHDNRAETVRLAAAAIGLPETQQETCTYRLFWDVGFTARDRAGMTMTAQQLQQLGKIEKIPALDAYGAAQ